MRGSYHTVIDYGVLLCTETYKTLYPLESALVSLFSELVDQSIDLVRVPSPKYILIFIPTTMTIMTYITAPSQPWCKIHGSQVLLSARVCHPPIPFSIVVIVHIPAKSKR